jgi:sugar phosphate isomerase/epimerase
MTEYLAKLDLRIVGICWDVANYFGGGLDKAMPTPAEVQSINHVHVHDRHPGGAGFHAPLGSDGILWRQAIQHLRTAGWSGAITLEIRYRYALERADPWSVLADSLDQVRETLIEE